MSKHIGYIRVSSIDQNTDRQLTAVTLDKTFEEKASAKDTQRPQLQACLEYLRDGDTLHVHSIDRLARSLVDLQTIVDSLTGRGVTVQFHKENLTFTGGEDRSALNTLMFQMMGAFAQFERAMIRERQREGIEAAKRQGKQIGAKKKLTPEQIEDIKRRLAEGADKKALAKELGISRTTLYAALVDAEGQAEASGVE